MPEKTTVITAALPYANGPIHAGHLVEYVQADIFARHMRAKGNSCLYVCADDAHGAAIQLRAEAENIDPVTLINQVNEEHQADFALFNISFDVYHSTHSPENEELVGLIYERLCKARLISKKVIEQLYDVKSERFLADRYVKGTCPFCAAPDQYGDGCESCGATYSALDLINPIVANTGDTPVIRSSEHLFFDLPAMQDFLDKWRQDVGLQPAVNNKLDEWSVSGLQPWDISRDAPYFGFEVPDQPGKYFYVWVDAPVGYLASLKKYCDEKGMDFWKLFTNPDTDLIHFIGKDIAYFHTLFWPAMLHAAQFRLPTSVFCHGFLTVNGAKMSKSRGTFITARKLAQAFDPDFFRYFIFSMLDGSLEDIDLNFMTFKERVNADLIGKIINIGSRSGAILQRVSNGNLSRSFANEEKFDALLKKLGAAREHIDHRRYAKACRQIVQCAEAVNKWLSEEKPWLAAKGDASEQARAMEICSQALWSFRAIMIALAPITPNLYERAKNLWELEENNNRPLLYASMDPRPITSARFRPFVSLLKRLTEEQVNII